MKVATRSGENEELKRLRWINGVFGRRALMGAVMSYRRVGDQRNEHAERDPPGD